MFCRQFYGRSIVLQDLCSNPGSIEEFRRKCEIGVFNESIDNSMMELFARIISNALCWYKYRKTNKMFYIGQIIPGTEML